MMESGEKAPFVRNVPITKLETTFCQSPDSFLKSGRQRFERVCREMDEESEKFWKLDEEMKTHPQWLESICEKSTETSRKHYFKEETSTVGNFREDSDDYLPLDETNFMTDVRDDRKVFELKIDARNFQKGILL